MNKKRILVIGLEPSDVQLIKQNLGFEYLFVHYDLLPQVQLINGLLFVESPNIPGKYLEVNIVIFHGIFENDLDLITLLALWNGPCLPNALGMMNLRQRIPGLVRSLAVSKFSTIRRGMVIGSQEYFAETDSVAKWGIWHCGEDKQRFTGNWVSQETSVIEEFIDGEAVRIMLICEKYWQIKLSGDTWLKSIHDKDSYEMEVDDELLTDSRKLAKHFGLQIVGIDYMLATTGERYLLEVNHIPNVTVFPFVNKAFIEFSVNWIALN